MDPNATLARLREAIADAERAMDPESGSNDAEHESLSEITELAAALDEWLSRGGFLPDAWQQSDERDAQYRARAQQLRARLDQESDPFKRQCDRHGGPWGDDPTCAQCTTVTGRPRP